MVTALVVGFLLGVSLTAAILLAAQLIVRLNTNK